MTDRNLFSAGTYAVQGGFARAIACFSLDRNDARSFRFLLVNVDAVSDTEEEAAVNAQADLKEAHAAVATTGNDKAMALHLTELGYCRLEEEAPPEEA